MSQIKRKLLYLLTKMTTTFPPWPLQSSAKCFSRPHAGWRLRNFLSSRDPLCSCHQMPHILTLDFLAPRDNPEEVAGMDDKPQGFVAAPERRLEKRSEKWPQKWTAARVSACLLHPAQRGAPGGGGRAGSGNRQRLGVQSIVQRLYHGDHPAPKDVMVLPCCCRCSSQRNSADSTY